jgi:excinuclease ABC subunit C
MFDIKSELLKLPKEPGIYQFFDKNGNLLYIGKAKVLKNRVPQYFRLNGDSRPMIGQMVGQIDKIKTVVTESEIEALFLESELIRRLLPKYNVRLRDDKTFLMIKITREIYPRVLLIRYQEYDPKDKTGQFFGPYTSGDALRRALKILRKIFMFADCTESKSRSYSRKNRPCLFGMIKQCQAPCIEGITREEYRKEIGYLKLFLQGKKQQLVKSFEKEMKLAAKTRDYERASELRDKIEALKHLNRSGIFVSDQLGDETGIKRIEAYDISNISGELAVGSMTVVTDGSPEPASYRKFKINSVEGPNDVAMISEVLERRFHNDWPLPDLVVIDGGQGQFFAAKKIIEKLNIETKLLSIAKGPTRKKDELIYDDPALAKMVKKDDNLIRLIKLARDEAHRFAVSYFHKRQIKRLITGKE